MNKQLESMKKIDIENKQNEKFYNEQVALINKYINTFYELYERKPLSDEIISNISEQIDEKCLETFLKTYKPDIDNNIV